MGYALKSASGWESYKGKPGNGSDAFGFGALPAGTRESDESYESDGTFGGVLKSTCFWSSTENFVRDADFRVLCYFDTDLNARSYYKNDALSVRCVED